jgi:uncharacterized membrane protein
MRQPVHASETVRRVKERLAGLASRLPNNRLIDAALIGAATGGRTSAGLAALAWSAPAGADDIAAPKPLAFFQKWFSKPLQTAGLIGELVVDKLPATGSRLERGPFIGRIATGSTAASALAQRQGEPVWPAAAVGALGAAAGSVVGAKWRALAARRGIPDLGPAIIEDIVTLALAAYACRPRAVNRGASETEAWKRRWIDLTDGARVAQPRVN